MTLCVRTLPRQGIHWVVHPRRPKDFLRPERCPEGRGKSWGDVQPNTSRLQAVYGHSLIINPYLGRYQEIHPCRVVSIGSVRINTYLIMMRECKIHCCTCVEISRQKWNKNKAFLSQSSKFELRSAVVLSHDVTRRYVMTSLTFRHLPDILHVI